MQEILTLLFSRGDVLPAKTIPNWERAPWLEQIYFRDALQDTATPRLITTHLPARILAPALQQSKAKVRGGPARAGESQQGHPEPMGLPTAGVIAGGFLSRMERTSPPTAVGLMLSPPQVIYVARNPKDVVVSFYHFHRLAKFLPNPGSFDTFLTQFLEGTGKGWGPPAILGRGPGAPHHPLPPPSALRLLV